MIEGIWKLIGGEKDGEDISAEELAASTLEVVGDSHAVSLAEGEIKGSHTLNSDVQPMTIDANDTHGPFAGQTTLGIFRVEDDVFTVCFAAPGDPRPTEFTTKNGKATILHQWKRA